VLRPEISPATHTISLSLANNGDETLQGISLHLNHSINPFKTNHLSNGAEIRPETNPKFNLSTNGLPTRPKIIPPMSN
jgi:hypothetical protein